MADTGIAAIRAIVTARPVSRADFVRQLRTLATASGVAAEDKALYERFARGVAGIDSITIPSHENRSDANDNFISLAEIDAFNLQITTDPSTTALITAVPQPAAHSITDLVTALSPAGALARRNTIVFPPIRMNSQYVQMVLGTDNVLRIAVYNVADVESNGSGGMRFIDPANAQVQIYTASLDRVLATAALSHRSVFTMPHSLFEFLSNRNAWGVGDIATQEALTGNSPTAAFRDYLIQNVLTLGGANGVFNPRALAGLRNVEGTAAPQSATVTGISNIRTATFSTYTPPALTAPPEPDE